MVEIVLGLAGTIGAGKDTVSSYIRDKYGFEIIIMGDLVREEADELGLEPNRENLESLQKEKTEKYGIEYWIKKAIEKIKKAGWERVIINGIRRPIDAKVPKDEFGYKFKLILVDADPKIRFERLEARGRTGDPQTMEEFEKQEAAEWSLFNFTETIKAAEERIINNAGLEALYKKVDELMKKLGIGAIG